MEINLRRQLTPFEWLQLPPDIRRMFKETFNIPRSSGTVVIGDRVESDGHTIDDLSRVSLKSLQEYLGTEEDHWDRLLQLTINKMENGNDKELDPAIAESPRVEQGTVSGKRRGPKVKKAI